MNISSKKLAKGWRFPRHRKFERILRVAASNWFYERKYAVNTKHQYILEKWEDWPRNIILPQVVNYIKEKSKNKSGENFPLHKYLHHGLSSQALLFYLVGPLIVSNDLEPLKKLIEKKGLEWKGSDCSAELEYDDRNVFNEDSGQPTSIDLVIKDAKGNPYLFIESKLSEKEFGGCSVYKLGDCDGQNPANDKNSCFLHFIRRRYWDLLEKHGFVTKMIASDSLCILVNNYQFFRELLFAIEKGGGGYFTK